MAVEARPELVGKRFLCVGGDQPPETGDMIRWPWRSGVIRAVNNRESDNNELTVYVEFDDQEWEKREWVKVYEDFQVFLLEHQLVWAKRKEGAAGGGGGGALLQGTKAKLTQWPALAFKPVVGKNLLSSVTAVEFLLDRKLDFLSDLSSFQPYQDEVDSQSPVFRDHPQLHEEVKVWLKDQKVQEIFMQGPYSLNGYRVRVYRQDSATQWFTGIITHHDLFSRNMVVMNDQVLEPQNVDPSMIQMTFLDDVVHSLLKGENIGITSRRRSRSSQNNNTAHMAGGRPGGTTGSTQSHYTRAQANSPRPILTSGPTPKGSQGTPPHQQGQQQVGPSHQSPGGKEQRSSRPCRRKGSDSSVPEEDRREEAPGRESRSKVKPSVGKRRRGGEEEERGGLKRLKTDVTSDLSESSDSEHPHPQRPAHSCCSSSSSSSSMSSSSSSSSEPTSENELKAGSGDGTKTEVAEGPLHSSGLLGQESPWAELQAAEDVRKSVVKETSQIITKQEEELVAVTQITRSSPRRTPSPLSDTAVTKTSVKASSPSETPCLSQLHAAVAIPDDAQATVHRESSEAVSALLASQKAESPSPYPPLNPSPASSPPVPPSPSPSEGGRRAEPELHAKRQGMLVGGGSSVKSSKVEFALSEVIRPVASLTDATVPLQKDVDRHQHPPHRQRNPPLHLGGPPSVSGDARKHPQQQPTPPTLSSAPPLDPGGPGPGSAPLDALRQTSQNPPSTNTAEPKLPPGPLDTPRPKPSAPPETPKQKVLRYADPSPPPAGRLHAKAEPEPVRSGFKAVPLRPEGGGAGSTKSPLIIDKNETFTVYRDPALVRSDAEPSTHLPAYLHLHPLHPPAPHSPCLAPGPHTAPHLLGPPHSSALPHPHMLPAAMLPALPAPAASLLGGHARLDSPGSLGPLALPHPAVSHQQQFLQGHGGAPGLGLYPILWSYPNGSGAAYPPGLNLPASWVHSEGPVSSKASLRRNAASPWLHQTACSDGLGPLNHVPVRPASADAHRPPASKAIVTVHQEPRRPEPTDRSRTPTGKDVHRLYLDPPGKARLAGTQDAVQGADRAVRYKEENRQILQESIQVAPFTAKVPRPVEPDADRDPAFQARRPVLASPGLKSVPPLDKSSYFTTLSNSVVNEPPPRLYPSKELGSYYDRPPAAAPGGPPAQSLQSGGSLSSFGPRTSLSKPPPLIKHKPEGAEGLAGKITEQLSQQGAPVHASADRHSPVVAPPAPCPASNHHRPPQQLQQHLRAMPSLHRAPVFHPPTQHALERREASEWERGGYGGRLSPPTLTPIQPVSLAVAGAKTEQQKPPTLLPELRDIKSHAAAVGVAGSGGAMADGWRGRGAAPGPTPPAATASVIVRPAGAARPAAALGPPRPENPADPGAGGVIQHRNASMQCMLGRLASSPPNSFCRSSADALAGPPRCRWDPAPPTAAPPGRPHQHPVPPRVRENPDGADPSRTSPPTGSAGPLGPPRPGAPQPYPPSFIHLKKHKAALAAAQSRGSVPVGPGTPPQPLGPGTPPSALDSLDKPPGHCCTPPPCSSSGADGPPGPAPGGPLSNYHKLKKAWLTRHSEEDRSTSSTSSSVTSAGARAEKALAACCNAASLSDMIRPCTVNLRASTSAQVEASKDCGSRAERRQEEKASAPPAGGAEERRPAHSARRGSKRSYDSGSESGADDSDASESKMEGRAKRQPKPTYKKKQNDLARRRAEGRAEEREEDDGKPNGIFRSAREKTKLKLASSNGVPRSVLKDWRKVKKLKQTGESFLQDDSCSEIGPGLQKCRECRLVRSRKGEEPAHSPVFCRFYYFRRLSFSKNGVIRTDGFSAPEQFDEEALALWVPGTAEDGQLDRAAAAYILGFIGDKFCQMVTTENAAASGIKKDSSPAWKRAVRGVREMCDACEATLFNLHWVCQKCGFVVCLDCYRARERRSPRDKELYGWLKCVKGQPHDHKHLMPTQIIPGTVLTELLASMHSLRDQNHIRAHCPCPSKTAVLAKLPATNGVSQVLQNVLNHSNKLVKAEPGHQQDPDHAAETNGGGGRAGGPGSDAGSAAATPPESRSPLHFLADLAEQKSREEKKENKDVVSKCVREDGDGLEVLQQCRTPSLVGGAEQGSTLRDLLTTTAGKLKLGSTDAGIAFAPVYTSASQAGKGGQPVPNILDDIIASVVENKIPAGRQNITAKLSVKPEVVAPGDNAHPAATEDSQPEKKRPAAPEGPSGQPPGVPHCWLGGGRLLWLKDHRNQNNWRLFRESWGLGQPVLVSGIHRRLNGGLWRADSFNQEFADHQGDLLNCRDQVVSNSGIKEFWDGFEDLTKRPRSRDGEPAVFRLKDWPSGEEFMTLMPSRYDDLMRNLPLPEYSDPEGSFNLASHLPPFFVRPDLGPRLCCAYGVAASQDQDFGTANLHVEVSDVVSVLVYVGVAKGNGVLSKTGVLKRLEEEDLDEGVRRRLKDSSETPGALWHIYLSRDMDRVREFLHQLCREQGLDVSPDQDPVREQGRYLSRKQRQRLLEEHGVQGCTVVQFLGDSVLVPAGSMHQVQNLHSCVQVINDFVSPEHVSRSFQLTQELRPARDEVNYEDKLQVKNILYHCVKEAVRSLRRSAPDKTSEEDNS